MNRLTPWIPFISGVSIAFGIIIGTLIGPGFQSDAGLSGMDKLKAILGYVESHYVDSVNTNELVELSIQDILRKLDPHSGYYNAAEATEMNEPLQGNFQGVGIEYNIIRDTIVVLNVIRGGPSDSAGVKTGDRIIAAEKVNLTGDSAKEKIVKGRLRGPAGTAVNVTVLRPGVRNPIEIRIVRGSIPIYSVESYYMLDAATGYIRLTRFAETSYDEFLRASDSLRKLGMKKLVFDLRGNGGGLLKTAIEICDEFLSEGNMIVYTKGRADGEEKVMATAKGSLENTELAVLIDENSASASEIVAGAIQDNDRGTIVGRRSFGKGLVQEEIPLADGSSFRLTIARYYTPSGRCIQKPYNNGIDHYESEAAHRYDNGELLNADSIHFPDSLKYKTKSGRLVYGGGGIMPDIFVPMDTAGNSKFLNDLYYSNAFVLWALELNKTEGNKWKTAGVSSFRRNYIVTDGIFYSFLKFAETNGVKRNSEAEKQSDKMIRRYIKAYAARALFDDEGYFPVWNDDDPVVQTAITALNAK
jgi:carboxyl-terminal processing protease